MELKSYQKEGLTFLQSRKTAGLFFEMGLGKSLILLEHFKLLSERAEIFPILIVCPLSGVGVWRQECQKFGYSFVIQELVGTRQQRLKGLTNKADIYVINYDGLRVMELQLKKMKWGIVVGDESHRCKDRGAKQTKVFTDLCQGAERRYLLTGTPIVNSPEDIYSQIHAIAPGYLSNYWAFCNRYIDYKKLSIYVGNGRYREVRKATKFKNLDELRQKLECLTIRKTKKECLDLPEKIYKVIFCNLTPEQKRHYWSLKMTLATELEQKRFQVASAAVVIQKLQQVCQGFLYDGEAALHFESCKWNILKDLMIDIQNESSIIFTWYRYDAIFLAKALREAGYDVIAYDGVHAERVEQIREFQESGKPKIFLSNIEKAKEAITLTRASNIIYYGNSWSYGSRIQSEDRAHRIGVRHPVIYYDLVVPNTIDQIVYETLKSKGKMADKITGDTKRLAQMICEQ